MDDPPLMHLQFHLQLLHNTVCSTSCRCMLYVRWLIVVSSLSQQCLIYYRNHLSYCRWRW